MLLNGNRTHRRVLRPFPSGGFMLLMIFVVLLVLALAGGGWGHSRYGYAGWSPAGIIVLLFVVLWLTGNLHV
jgi:hypothetical protein